jgi:hypothetical protein
LFVPILFNKKQFHIILWKNVVIADCFVFGTRIPLHKNHISFSLWYVWYFQNHNYVVKINQKKLFGIFHNFANWGLNKCEQNLKNHLQKLVSVREIENKACKYVLKIVIFIRKFQIYEHIWSWNSVVTNTKTIQ